MAIPQLILPSTTVMRWKTTSYATNGRDFSFGLYTDVNAEPVDTATVTGVTKAAAAEASFDPILYTQADVATGTFTYYIKEIIPAGGNPVDGITYDDTVYTVVVTLTDDEAGNIGISYTVDGNDVDESIYKFAFENKFERTPEPTPTEPAPTEPAPTQPTPSDNPKTGDNTPVTLLAVLMVFSLACLFVLVLNRKRETN